MPWLHGFVGKDESVLTAIVGSPNAAIPLYVLVDERGKIIASSPQLRADGLATVLERVLSAPDTPAKSFNVRGSAPDTPAKCFMERARRRGSWAGRRGEPSACSRA